MPSAHAADNSGSSTNHTGATTNGHHDDEHTPPKTSARSNAAHQSSANSSPTRSAVLAKHDSRHRFEIMRKLGSGTYGKVSLAYDHKLNREVAVKLIKKSAIENKQDLVRIKREIRIMSLLKHPHIVEIYEGECPIALLYRVGVPSALHSLATAASRSVKSICVIAGHTV